jgi:hypothetical protein
MPRGQSAASSGKSSNTESTKTRRSPAEKAQDELDAAQKRVVKASDAYEEAQRKADEAKAEYDRAVNLHDHAARHPDLPRDESLEASADAHESWTADDDELDA